MLHAVVCWRSAKGCMRNRRKHYAKLQKDGIIGELPSEEDAIPDLAIVTTKLAGKSIS